MDLNKKEENQNPNTISRISSGMKIVKGEVTLEHDLRIDGYFEGNLTSTARVIIGEGAQVIGDITCNNLDVWGKIEGKIIVKDCLSMKKGSDITGEVHTANIVSEIGAKLNGTTKIIDPESYTKLTEKLPVFSTSK